MQQDEPETTGMIGKTGQRANGPTGGTDGIGDAGAAWTNESADSTGLAFFLPRTLQGQIASHKRTVSAQSTQSGHLKYRWIGHWV
ncbi:hypothetical protein [Paraburkholderia bannensis]|uniref:hypothetical protein n=1 Tax=Paraburkholderia bannensis TaxID=765414 RepID=UPI002AB78D58|nr:hypothetical protein [Paraburkholderia bannensis]